MLPRSLFSLGPALWVTLFKTPSYLKIEGYCIKWIYQILVKARKKISTYVYILILWVLNDGSKCGTKTSTSWIETNRTRSQGNEFFTSVDCSRFKYLLQNRTAFFFFFFLSYSWNSTEGKILTVMFGPVCLAQHFTGSGLKSLTYLYHYYRGLYS